MQGKSQPSPQKITIDLRFHQFVEDEGTVVFYKNAYGLAKVRPVFKSESPSDSGVELEKE